MAPDILEASSLKRIACVAALLTSLCAESDALAQSAVAQPPAPDSGMEIGLFYGVNRGLFSLAEPFAQGLSLGGFREVRIDSEPTHQPIFGVNVGGHLGRYVLAFTEFLYNDLGDSLVSGRPGLLPRVTVEIHPRWFEWTGGVRFQVPVSGRVYPSLAAGIGVARLMTDASGASVVATSDLNDFTQWFGLSVRVFLGSSFGVAPEYRIVRIPDDTFHRLLVSAVFRIR